MSQQQHQQQQRKRKRVSHRGICNGCGGNLTSSNAFSKHIYKKCFNTIPLISTGIPGGDFSSASILEEAGREEGYIVNITCENDPKSFWIYAGVPKSFTLGQFDHFLKVIWCDCGCGHLSSFSVQTTQGWKKDAEKFETNIGTIFDAEGFLSLHYTFDFGSSLYVKIEKMAGITKKYLRPDHIIVIARNSLPELTCDDCGAAVGKYICHCNIIGSTCLTCLRRGIHDHDYYGHRVTKRKVTSTVKDKDNNGGDKEGEEDGDEDDEEEEEDEEEEIDYEKRYPDGFPGDHCVSLRKNSPRNGMCGDLIEEVIENETRVDFFIDPTKIDPRQLPSF